jgi:hypothetical protein
MFNLIKLIIICAILTLIPIGWCMNIYKFANADFEAPYKAEIVRGISIFIAPVGGVMGYIDFDEEK